MRRFLKTHAKSLAYKKGYDEEYELLCSIERLAPQVFAEEKHGPKKVCANVDLFSGLIYRMLGISEDLYTRCLRLPVCPAGVPTASRRSSSRTASSAPPTSTSASRRSTFRWRNDKIGIFPVQVCTGIFCLGAGHAPLPFTEG